ncbi:MAG: hypothetical protein AAGA60_04480 [Cyanobacteria bacterium P01_E01_bin.42]
MSEQDRQSLEEQFKTVIENTKDDKNYNAVKALTSFIPGVGGAVGEFYSSYVTAPATKRLYEFLESLVIAIQELEEKVVDELNLEKESFQTNLMYALQIASRNHQKEKLEALRNTVLNSALSISIEEDRQILFLSWLDELTITHLTLLDLICNLSSYAEDKIIPWLKTNTGQESFKVEIPILGKFNKNPDFYNVIIKDIESKGLVDLNEIREISLTTNFDYLGKINDSIYLTWNDNISVHLVSAYQSNDFKTKVGLDFLLFVKSPL